MAKIIPDDYYKKCSTHIPTGFVDWTREHFRRDETITHQKGGKVGFCWHCRRDIISLPIKNPDIYEAGDFFEERMAQGKKYGCPLCGTVSDCVREDGNTERAQFFGFVALFVKSRSKDGGVWVRIFYIDRVKFIRAENLTEYDRIYLSKRGCTRWAMNRLLDNAGPYYNELPWRIDQVGPQRMSNATPQRADKIDCIYPKNLEAACKGTPLENVEFAKEVNFRAVFPYPLSFALELHRRPALEQFHKKGLSNIVAGVTAAYNKYDINEVHWQAKTFREILKFPTWFLQQKPLDEWSLSDFKQARRLFEREQLTDRERIAEFKWLQAADVTDKMAERVLKAQERFRITTERFRNYVTRQIERDQNASLSIYLDYLDDCAALELDTTNEKILFPQELMTAHANTMCLKQTAKLQPYYEPFKQRAKKFKRVFKSGTWKSGELVIFPPTVPENLIIEGAELSHCVGSTSYIKNHAGDGDIILFVRKADAPNKPYFTLRIDKNGVVGECRTKNNVSYDNEPTVKAAVEQFLQTLKGRKL